MGRVTDRGDDAWPAPGIGPALGPVLSSARLGRSDTALHQKQPDSGVSSDVVSKFGAKSQSATPGSALISYGMNRFLGWYVPGTTDYVLAWGKGDAVCDSNYGYAYCGDQGYPTSAIQRSSEIVMISEYGQLNRETPGNYPGPASYRQFYHIIPTYEAARSEYNCIAGEYVGHYWGPTSIIRVSSNHLETTNMLFVDGHVKAIKVCGNANRDATPNEWLPTGGGNNDPVLDTHWHPDK